MSDTILGIDLGTTNSEVAVLRDGQPVVLDEDGDPILPSVVGLGSDGRLLIGHAARNQAVVAPERTIRSIKRSMGEDVRVRLGEAEYRPQEISALILRALKSRAERQLGGPVRKAVITVPAYFRDAQRQATREAGLLAGLEVVRILNEPTAAALAYDPGVAEHRRVLVYDLGGGTFDVSVVSSESGVVEVLASHGDTHLGGDDFDDLLLHWICDQFREEHGIELRDSLAARARLLRAVEDAKKQLSDHPETRLTLEFVAEKNQVPLHIDREIGRADYEALIRPLVMRTLDCVRQTLEDAALTPRDLDRIVLVGGATRTPMIAEMLEDLLGHVPCRQVNPDLIVAMGAAVQGGIIAGLDVGAVLVDVTPHSLGIKCMDEQAASFGLSSLHRFAAIIDRNTPLPVSRSELFHTVEEEQTTVEIDVYQGENLDVRLNHRVGRFLVEGLARVPAGNTIRVQLDLNLDGMLRVSAREKATGLEKQITIDNALARFEREELAGAQERLEEIWGESFPESRAEDEPREMDPEDADAEELAAEELDAERANVADTPPSLQPGPREGQRESVQARALLEKTERLLAGIPPEDRAEVEKLMARVRDALTDRRWKVLSAAMDELADVLFYIEDA